MERKAVLHIRYDFEVYKRKESVENGRKSNRTNVPATRPVIKTWL